MRQSGCLLDIRVLVPEVILPLSQLAVVALWFLAALVSPTIARVPDTVIEDFLPVALALLFVTGFVMSFPRPSAALVIGTALCAVTVHNSLAIRVLMPTSLPDF